MIVYPPQRHHYVLDRHRSLSLWYDLICTVLLTGFVVALVRLVIRAGIRPAEIDAEDAAAR